MGSETEYSTTEPNPDMAEVLAYSFSPSSKLFRIQVISELESLWQKTISHLVKERSTACLIDDLQEAKRGTVTYESWLVSVTPVQPDQVSSLTIVVTRCYKKAKKWVRDNLPPHLKALHVYDPGGLSGLKGAEVVVLNDVDRTSELFKQVKELVLSGVLELKEDGVLYQE